MLENKGLTDPATTDVAVSVESVLLCQSTLRRVLHGICLMHFLCLLDEDSNLNETHTILSPTIETFRTSGNL